MNKITLRFLLFAFFAINFQLSAQGVVINELLASNQAVNADEDGDFEDWVELFNPGSSAVILNGYGLSDDSTEPYKWIFPNVTVPAGGYLLIWCSDKDRTNPSAPLHTNFKISASGESIFLTSATGSTVDSSPPTAMIANVSWGRLPNGSGNFTFFESPTPNAQNSTAGSSGELDIPVFSHPAGFYTSEFSLSITSNDPDAQIIYTLDGSEPEASNLGGTTYTYKNSYEEMAGQPTGPFLEHTYQTLEYTAPITVVDRSTEPNKIAQISSTQHFAPVYFPQGPIFKGTVVRAKAIKEGAIDSPSVTMTYFVTPQGNNAFSIPMVCSISMNEDSLFEYNDGIYVAGKDFDEWREEHPTTNTTPYNFEGNFHRKGDWSERLGHIEMFVDGNQIVNQDVGIRLSGDSSRAWPSKSFSLIARPELGNGSFQYQFFPDVPVTTFDRLLLRNSGNDFRRTMYRDALVHRLVSGILETQAYRPTITFLNGEYWGILNLRERYDKYYFKNVYGIDEGDLDMLENNFAAEEGDDLHYVALEDFLENNSLEIQENFDYAATQLDPDDFRDYFITNIYLSNTDWPGWNHLYWRKRTENFSPDAPEAHDGRWRTAMKDADAAFGLGVSVNNHNTLAMATAANGPSYPNPPRSTLVIRKLLENQDFETNFINRFADMLNTYFKPERVVGMSTEMKNILLPEIQDHIDRWKAVEFVWWNIHINNIHTFAQERPDYQRSHIREKFNISHDIDATLDVSDPEHGYIKMNTIDILATTPGINADVYPWTGIYFSDVPVTLKAIAKPGYVFSHWEGESTSTEAEVTITTSSDFEITAVFVPDSTPAQDAPLYFWMADNSIPNDLPIQNLASSYEANSQDAMLNFQSSFSGYPFDPSHPNWRKGSLERRNNPTPINYMPSANNDITYAASDMKGLQVRQPLENAGLQSMLTFDVPTSGYKDVKFSFAAVNEGAASGLIIEYSTAAQPQWTSTGLAASFPLGDEYQLYEADLSAITSADNNADLKIRIRFQSSDMTADNGGRVTFNNFALTGDVISLGAHINNHLPKFVVHPNPFRETVFVAGVNAGTEYTIVSMDGRIISRGYTSAGGAIDASKMNAGVYLLQLTIDGVNHTRKIVKR